MIGEVRVRAAVEVSMAVPPAAVVAELSLESAAEHLGWLQPDYVDTDGNIRLAVQSFLVESAGRRIIVDTCFGHGHALPYDLGIDTRPFPATLAAARLRARRRRCRRVHPPPLRPRRLERGPDR